MAAIACPNGYVPALSADNNELVVFDFQTQKWTELAKGSFGWLNWAKHGQCLEVVDQSGTESVIRIRMSDGRIERILDLKDFVATGFWAFRWLRRNGPRASRQPWQRPNESRGASALLVRPPRPGT